MKLFSFIKDKIVFIILQISLIFFLAIVLNQFKINNNVIILICLCIVLEMILSILYEYTKKNSYYKKLYKTMEELDKKQYLGNMIEEPDFLEAEILNDILQQTTKAMNDEIATYRHAGEDYRDYIETWIHEIKLPISCISLICNNNNGTLSTSINEEVDRIDRYVEQALYYARSTNLEKDYSVREISLDKIVKTAIKKHSKQLISAKVELSFSKLEYSVYCDPKWLDFIIGQLISNSIKYRKNKLLLSFSAKETIDSIDLSISDNGIGICEKDMNRVFEKGFTGENGRNFAKSTGIGLYLCKQLSEKMNLGFKLYSQVEEGTIISIIFPKDSRVLLK